MKLSLFCFLSLASFSVHAFAEDALDPLYRPYIAAGGKVGSQRDIGEAEVFLPIAQIDTQLLYGNLKWKEDKGPGWESNLGIGVRKIYNNDYILGVYLMGDSRETESQNNIKQVTIGAELLSENNDLRVNAYLPERDKKLASTSTSSFQVGTQIFIKGSDVFEQAAPGFDIEIGQKLPFNQMDVRAYIAAYHFSQPQAVDMNGARFRVSAKTEDFRVLKRDIHLQFDAEAQDDNIRHDSYFAGAKIVIPFGESPKRKLTNIQSRMTEIPHRDIDIVVTTSKKADQVVAAKANINGNAYSEVHEIDAANAADIATTVSGISSNALIRLKVPSVQLVSSPILLKDGQALMGGDQNLVVRGSNGRSVILDGNSITSHLIKATAIGAANPLIVLPNGGSASIYDLSLTNEDGSTGDANVMISNLNNPVSNIRIGNVYSTGSLYIDTLSGSSDITVDDSFIYGGIFRAHNNASIKISLDNNEFRRTFAVAQIFPQNITSSLYIESMDTSIIHVTQITNNLFVDEKSPVGGRASLGLGFVQSSSNAMIIDKLVDNTITRTGGWDAGAILSQGVGGDLIYINEFHGNTGDDFTAVSSRINIGQAGYVADGTGFTAANGGMVYGDYGNNQVTNIIP